MLGRLFNYIVQANDYSKPDVVEQAVIDRLAYISPTVAEACTFTALMIQNPVMRAFSL